MKYAQMLEISAVAGDENYELFLKHAKMLIIKDKEKQGYAEAEIEYNTYEIWDSVPERRFKYLPMWFNFLTKYTFYPKTRLVGSWEA